MWKLSMGIIAFYVLIVGFAIGSWVVNFTKLTNCDFESPYKCEIIHGIGVIPPFQFATVWFASDADIITDAKALKLL